MDGLVNFPVRLWKNAASLASLLAGLLIAAPGVDAQNVGGGKVYSNTSTTIPAGRYDSPVPIHLYGGPVSETGNGGPFPTAVDVSVAEGTELQGVTLVVGFTNLRAKDVFFRQCTIDVSPGGNVTFENCYFDGVTFLMSPGLPAASAPGSTTTPDRSAARLELENCVLHKVQFQGKGDSESVMGLRMNQCTVHGPGSMLPMLISQPKLLENLKAAKTQIAYSSFTQCSYTSAMLAITKHCSFDTCTLVPGLPLAEITEPLKMTVDILPEETAGQVAAQLPQYVIKPLGPGVPPGSKLAYSISKGELSRNTLPNTAPLRPLASVLPPLSTAQAGTVTTSTRGALLPGSTPSMTTAVAAPMEGVPDSGLKLQQANVHGLLIMSLAGGEAGSASKMAAVALKVAPGITSTVRFNQPVGDMMAKALQEVAKFIQVNNGGWPKGYQIELSFADKYSGKDGPSAAVACALLLHSLISGEELDQTFAVTGDMNADGSVQPIGGVTAKIRGATHGHCKIIGIPAKNETSLGDLLLTDGPLPFAKIQIYSLKHFDDAQMLALAVKSPTLQASIEEMKKVQDLLLRDPPHIGAWLRNQHVVTKLQQVLQEAPNNLSAKYLLMYASGKLPQTLTLAGSLEAIDNSAGELIGAMNANRGEVFDNTGKASVGSSITRLQSVRARCDARARPYADAVINFGTAVKEAHDRPSQTASRSEEQQDKIRAAAATAKSELDRLLNDPAVREELED